MKAILINPLSFSIVCVIVRLCSLIAWPNERAKSRGTPKVEDLDHRQPCSALVKCEFGCHHFRRWCEKGRQNPWSEKRKKGWSSCIHHQSPGQCNHYQVECSVQPSRLSNAQCHNQFHILSLQKPMAIFARIGGLNGNWGLFHMLCVLLWEALAKLQLPLADFRKLCILKANFVCEAVFTFFWGC